MTPIAAVLLFCATAQPFTFADIPRYATPAVVVQKLKAAGFKDIRKTKTQIKFRGSAFGRDAAGIAALTDRKLAKVTLFIPALENTRAIYDEVRDGLIARHGQPSQTISTFREPFHAGDGYETEAIRSGAAVFRTEWEGLSVAITPELSVVITYE